MAPTPRSIGNLVGALGIGLMLLSVPFADPTVALGGAPLIGLGAFIRLHRNGWRVARVAGALGIVVAVGLVGFAVFALVTAGDYGAIAAIIIAPVAAGIAVVSIAAVRTSSP